MKTPTPTRRRGGRKDDAGILVLDCRTPHGYRLAIHLDQRRSDALEEAAIFAGLTLREMIAWKACGDRNFSFLVSGVYRPGGHMLTVDLDPEQFAELSDWARSLNTTPTGLVKAELENSTTPRPANVVSFFG